MNLENKKKKVIIILRQGKPMNKSKFAHVIAESMSNSKHFIFCKKYQILFISSSHSPFLIYFLPHLHSWIFIDD